MPSFPTNGFNTLPSSKCNVLSLRLGAIVDVDAVGMAMSTVQVVLVPIVAGLFLNKTVPKVGFG